MFGPVGELFNKSIIFSVIFVIDYLVKNSFELVVRLIDDLFHVM